MNIKSFALTSVVICLNAFGMENNPIYAIVHDTDLQYGKKAQAVAKEGHTECIKSVIQQTPSLQQVVVATGGDQIDGHLSGGECGFCCSFCGLFCCKSGKKQTKTFQEKFLEPLEKTTHTKTSILVSPGNHEFNDPTLKMLDLIKKRHGNTYYTANLGPILIIVGAVYFDEKICAWAQKKIEEKQQALSEDNFPIVTINHFNPVGEHDAWYEREHDARLAKVLAGKNVIRLWGHTHATYKTQWEGHPGYCGGGKEFITLGFDTKGTQVSESAFIAQKQADGSFIPQACGTPEWTSESCGDDTVNEQFQRAWNSSVVRQHCFDKR